MPATSKRINVIIGADTRELNKSLKKSAEGMRRWGRRASVMGTDLMRSIAVPAAAAGAALLKFGGDLDAQKRALSAVMGSAKAAQKEFLALKEAAKAPGLDFQAAIQGSLRFQSMGIEADKARRILTGFGKAVALSGGAADEFGRTVQQLSDMMSRNKVTMEDWRRVITAAPAVINALRQEFDGMTDAVQIAEGIGFDNFMTRLTRRLNESEGAGNSLKNSLNNLSSSFQHAAGEVGVLFGKYSGLTKWIDRSVASLDHFAIKLMTNSGFARDLGINITRVAKVVAGLVGFAGITKLVGLVGMLGHGFVTATSGAIKLADALLGLEVARGLKGIGTRIGETMAGNIGKGLIIGFRLVNWAVIASAITYGIIEHGEKLTKGIAKFIHEEFPKMAERMRNSSKGNYGQAPYYGWGQETIYKALRDIKEDEIAHTNKSASGAFLSDQQKSDLIGLLQGKSLDEITGSTRKLGQEAKTTRDEWVEFAEVMEKYREGVKDQEALYKLTADKVGYLKAKKDQLQDTLVDLDVIGARHTDTFKDLKEQYDLVSAAINGIEGNAIAATEALKIMERIKSNALFRGITEENYEETKDKSKVLTKANEQISHHPAMRDILRLQEAGEDSFYKVGGGIGQITKALGSDETKEAFDFAEEKLKTMKNLGVGIGDAFGTAFAELISGTGSFSQVMQRLLAALIAKIISAIVAIAVLKAALKFASGGAAGAAEGVSSALKIGEIVAGILGSVGGLLIKKNYADGGVARSATPAVFGEYTNAYNRPELAGRVDQWAGLIEGFMDRGSFGGGQLTGVLRGSDIHLAVTKQQSKLNKSGRNNLGLELG